MRVALVVFGELADRSGGFRYDNHLRRVLTARGHHVNVVGQPDGLSYPRQFSLARGEWVDRVAVAAPDVVLIDELNHAATGAGIPALRRRLPRVPVVAVVHHLRCDEQPGRFRAGITERAFLRGCDAWLCNSSVTLHRVRKLSGVRRGSAVVFPAAYEGTEAAPTEAASAWRSPPPAPQESPSPPDAPPACRVIFVGNLIPRKNVHRLIRAIRALPETRLDLYGSDTTDPRYTRRLRRMITAGGLGERVTIHGRVSDETLSTAYREADLFAAPSAYEGFGIVYLEALSRGVPVVAGCRGGAAEIVTSDDAGVLVTPRVGAIISAIERACRTGGDRGGATPSLTGATRSTGAAARRERQLAAWRRSRAFPDWTETMTGAAHFLEEIVRRRRDG